jgi:hypothetical protein
MLSKADVDQLAPDAASIKAGLGQGKARDWQNAGRDASTVWGEIQGSGKNPYQSAVDFSQGTPAFSCTCPSQKRPCKHVLGLLYVYAAGQLNEGTPSVWVQEWLTKRAGNVAKKEAKVAEKQAAAEEIANDPEKAAKAALEAEKRKSKRDEERRAGIEQCQVWADDLLKQGLIWAEQQDSDYWYNQQRRMVDAKLPGLALIIDHLSNQFYGEHWQVRALGALSRLALLLKAWQRRDGLPEAARGDIETALGLTIKSEDVLSQSGVVGLWRVVGRFSEERDNIKTLRHWLYEAEQQQWAQVFHFAAGGQPLDTSLTVGTVFAGEVVYYPSVQPQRALIKQRKDHNKIALTGGDSIAVALSKAQSAWAKQPWRLSQPMHLRGVPREDGISDGQHFLPWHKPDNLTELQILSGGHPLHLFAEWDGQKLLFASEGGLA